ncbi:reverse transcriptase domain-containing protein [Tanacetum coccineum]
MLRDIDETFRTLRKINMKLNLKKCTFGAMEGMFLGYMIRTEGIKLCPDKTEAILQLPSSRTIKEVQSLNGKLASLNRFLSKSAEKSLALFKTLKKCIKKSDFHWTPEAKQAFKQLNQHLSELPLLVAPKPKEELIVYLSASHGFVNAVLTTKRGTAQTPVYFRLQRTITKIERHARRTQYHISAKDVCERTDPSGFPQYEALIAGLRIAAQMGVRNVHVCVDSKLVANQVPGTYVAKEENMVKYLENAKSLISGFANFSISQVPRSKNKKADALSKIVTLPNDRKEVSKLHIKARQYELLEGFLYRRSFLKSWLRCVGPLQADYVIREIHKGSCSMHAGPRFMVAKAMRLGYYWPTMHRDARDAKRIDIAGPFPEGPRKVKFLIFAMDYFTKWIEAKAVATITGSQVKKFMWDNIVSLGEGIKSCLGVGNKNWIEELPYVLWAHRTMIKSSHGDTPFSLTYGTKAVIPMEIGMPTYRTVIVDAVHNDEELRLNMDLLEERREHASIREAKAKLKMTKYYNARVRGVTFRPGDFVYRSNDASHAVDGGKLGPKWEGPYEIIEALRDGAYKLRSMDRTALPRTWNIANLKKCYL